MSRRMPAAADLTPPCYLPAFGSAAFRRQPHSAPPRRLNLMMIGRMTGPRGLSTAGSPRAAITLLCPTTAAAASRFPPGGSRREVATTRPSITTHTADTVFQCNCPGECNRDDSCDLLQRSTLHKLLDQLCQSVAPSFFSCLILRCTQGYQNLSQLSWGHDRDSLVHHGAGREGQKKSPFALTPADNLALPIRPNMLG